MIETHAERQSEMFADFIPGAGLRLLKSPDCAKRIAMVKLLTMAFRPHGKPLGSSAAVDVARLLGGTFDNSARRIFAMAAGVHKWGWLPAGWGPEKAAIEKEMRANVGILRRDLADADERLRRFEESGK